MILPDAKSLAAPGERADENIGNLIFRQRGGAGSVPNPASTAPSTELSASLLTTSAAGRWARVTEITSSSNRGGATRCVRRLDIRSITSVSATTEHRSSGQMGQPAACMIDSKEVLQRWRRGFSEAQLWPEASPRRPPNAIRRGMRVALRDAAARQLCNCDALAAQTPAFLAQFRSGSGPARAWQRTVPAICGQHCG